MLKDLKTRFDQWNDRHFDKLEHGLVGYGIVATGGMTAGFRGVLIGMAVVALVETLKERLLDTEFDWTDWCWSVGGGLAVVAVSVISWLF